MILGVIGGLGPMATAYFMELVTEMTDASIDQEHLEMIIYSKPQIPDRTSYILGRSEINPMPMINEVAQKLVSSGAQVIAIPCVTAHCFHDKLCSYPDVKILNAVRETCMELKSMNVSKVGIMATSGTIQSGLFDQVFAQEGIECVKPTKEIQELVMELIYDDIKSGRVPDESKISRIKDYFLDEGASKIVLGCTELSLISSCSQEKDVYVDALRILAKASIRECGYKVKEGY